MTATERGLALPEGVRPYYYDERAGVAIYHADCRNILPLLEPESVDLVLTDPPYGISYTSGWGGPFGDGSVKGDNSPALRDWVLDLWGDKPAIVFGSWKVPRPPSTRALLTWDKGSWGQGDLALPWWPSTEEIYVLGRGFTGRRGSPVYNYSARRSGGCTPERLHPMEKPVALIVALLSKCPPEWVIIDPFMGSGTTLRAAKDLGRRAIGIEISEAYCESAARRLSQEVLPL